MDILPGATLLGLSLYLKSQNTLVISDIHMGFEEAINKQGVLIPRFQLQDTFKRMDAIFGKISKPSRVIITGDVKHEFGKISAQEWRDTLKFIDYLKRNSDSIVLVKGNHDTILGPIAKKRNVTTADYFTLQNMYFHHGHKIPEDQDFQSADTLIIGHEHPAISIADGRRSELFKCFLKGKWQKKTLVVLPSMNAVTTGSDILKEELLSPFLHQDLDDFEVFVVEDKPLYFGKIKDLRDEV